MAWETLISQKYLWAELLELLVETLNFSQFQRENICNSKNTCLCETPMAIFILDQERKNIYPSNLMCNMQFCQLGQKSLN